MTSFKNNLKIRILKVYMFIHAKTLLSSAVKNFVSDLYGDIKKITGFM